MCVCADVCEEVAEGTAEGDLQCMARMWREKGEGR
jgi:hypothetical protein